MSPVSACASKWIIEMRPWPSTLATPFASGNVTEWLSWSLMVVTDSFDDNLYLSSRNLTDVLVVTAQQMDPVSLVHFPHVLLTKGAIAQLEESLA